MSAANELGGQKACINTVCRVSLSRQTVSFCIIYIDPNTGFGQVHLTPTKVIVSSLRNMRISTQGDFLVLDTKNHANDAVLFYEK